MKRLPLIAFSLLSVGAFAQPGVDTMRFSVAGVEVRDQYTRHDVNGKLVKESDTLRELSKSLSGWAVFRFQYGDSAVIVLNPGSPPPTYEFKLVFNADTTEAIYFGYNRTESHPRGMLVEKLRLVNIPVTNTATEVIIDLDSTLLVASGLSYAFDDGYSYGNGDRDHWWSRSTGKFASSSRVYFRYFKKQPPASVQGEGSSRISFYPNPVHDRLNIRGTGYGLRVTMYDMLGREVLAADIDTEAQLDVSQLEPGIYLLVIGGEMRKIIVQ